jgi:hypothetical protein
VLNRLEEGGLRNWLIAAPVRIPIPQMTTKTLTPAIIIQSLMGILLIEISRKM